jgi:hypothetical protein
MINSLGVTTWYSKRRFLMHEPGSVEQAMDVPLEDLVQVVTPEEAMPMFDKPTRLYMDMSAEEFLRRWDAGEYADDPDQPGVRRVYPHMAFVRPNH